MTESNNDLRHGPCRLVDLRHGTCRLVDVRAEMPNYAAYREKRRNSDIQGIAIHHSATAHPSTGLAMENAEHIFRYHVERRGWDHGGYHYLIRPNGLIEYALDEQVAAYHAGFRDPADDYALECGQFWNNRYLAVCLLGWFDNDRVVRDMEGQARSIPNYFTRPTANQMRSLVALTAELCVRYDIPIYNVRGHRELTGCHTRCPGENVDLVRLRALLDAEFRLHIET
jgi:N-acetyl-anhydromuramyl-L-alanine amidase AmpD